MRGSFGYAMSNTVFTLMLSVLLSGLSRRMTSEKKEGVGR